jgi:hypothetical protein
VCCLIVIGCFVSFARFVFHVFDCSLDVCFLVLYVFFVFLFLFCVFCVLFLLLYIVLIFSVYMFTDHCHRIETQLKLINITSSYST